MSPTRPAPRSARPLAVILYSAALASVGACRPTPASAPEPIVAVTQDPPATTPAPAASPAAEPSPSPPILRAGAGADDPPLPYPGLNDQYRERPRARTWAARFERDGREVYAHRKAILRDLHLEAGDRVADVGAGTGLFTVLLAAAVGPAGQVYAVDLMPQFLAHIGERCRRAGVTNVTLVQSSTRSVELAPASIDLAFLSDAYHHLEDPAAILASIRRALRPGGALVILDFERIPGTSPAWVFDHVRAGREIVVAEAEAAGFVVDPVGASVVLRENYFLRLRRPE